MLAIITALCTVLSVGIFFYNASSWFTFDNVTGPALEDFSKKNKSFYNSFWGFYPKLKRRHKKNMAKFMLYYLSARGFINFDIDGDKTIRIVNNAALVSKQNTVESYLLNRLFGTPEYIEYISDDAILGKEAVQLRKVKSQYKVAIGSCDYTSVVKKPVATTDGKRAIDYVSMLKESARYKKCMWMLVLFSYFPSAYYEGMIENNIIAIVPSFYLFVFVFAFLLSFSLNIFSDVTNAKAKDEPPKDKGTDSVDMADDSSAISTNESSANVDSVNISTTETTYTEKTGSYLIVGDENIPLPTNLKTFFQFFSLRTLALILKSKNHFVLAFLINAARFFISLGLIFFSSLFLVAFLSVTGNELTQPLSYLGCAMIAFSWLVKCIRRKNKRTYFAMRKKNNKSYMKFLKNAFKPAQLTTAAGPNDLTTLIPYSVLFNREKELQTVLPNTHESVPVWINAPAEMTFREIDKLIDDELNYERPIN